jgi:surfeit locus 1 family protein
MPFKVKNWKLILLTWLFVCLFVGLGSWQVYRAQQKKILLQTYATRRQHPPLSADMLTSSHHDWRFYPVTLQGHFSNQHTILLDNQIFHGRVGYEVYTPFQAKGLGMAILVDRGWVPLGDSRQQLPAIPPARSVATITGILTASPTYVAFGAMQESASLTWPLRVEFIHLPALARLLQQPLFPYVVRLPPHDASAFSIEWHMVTLSPERHLGYAVQWFALALTLLILSTALYRNRLR